MNCVQFVAAVFLFVTLGGRWTDGASITKGGNEHVNDGNNDISTRDTSNLLDVDVRTFMILFGFSHFTWF